MSSPDAGLRHIVILGAGPAGLTAACELALKPGFSVSVIEREKQPGGISRTVVYRGNRMDIGGHRFFSKSEWVMERWKTLLPPQGAPARGDPPEARALWTPGGPDPEKTDSVMLARKRLSRIYYRRRFFDYPVRLNLNTVRNLGACRTLSMYFL
ncbi:MAG: NAD(P)-binding protein [Desulfovibrio sp.]|jgi:phytoene dehydrogenase-like protein|nr:NAD(P)-binding protein [Desulfovibrio sp.]